MIQIKRSFGGKTSDFSSKEERNFQRKNLKAYLKGDKYFRFWFSPINGKPVWYETSEVLS